MNTWQRSFTQHKVHFVSNHRTARRSYRTDHIRPVCAVGDSLRLFSPCKINVCLRVVRRRDDGYHDLASLFHVIDLGDDMTVTQLPDSSSQDQLTCNVLDVPTDASNLVIKAFKLFRQKTGSKATYVCDLLKKVPHGAGLGGGSANAATALWAANELSGRPATMTDLIAWSAEIGSDISVFFSHGAAYCTGRGEIIEEVQPPLPLDTPLLLVKPPIGLSTPEIFKALDLEKRSTADPRGLLDGLSTTENLQEVCVNDLEQPAFDKLPQLKELKDRLGSTGQFSAVFMTGSGSTIVCIGDEKVPDFLKEEPQYKDLFISPAKFITRHNNQWYDAPTN